MPGGWHSCLGFRINVGFRSPHWCFFDLGSLWFSIAWFSLGLVGLFQKTNSFCKSSWMISPNPKLEKGTLSSRDPQTVFATNIAIFSAIPDRRGATSGLHSSVWFVKDVPFLYFSFQSWKLTFIYHKWQYRFCPESFSLWPQFLEVIASPLQGLEILWFDTFSNNECVLGSG